MTPEAQAALWTQVVTGGFTIAGVFLTLLFTNFQQRREDRRWKAGYYIQGRIDALTNLTKELYKLDSALLDVTLEAQDILDPDSDPNTDTITLIYIEATLIEQAEHCNTVAAIARIYLPADTHKQISAVARAILDTNRFLKQARSVPADPALNIPIQQEADKTHKAIHTLLTTLGEELNPPDLRQFHTAKRPLLSFWPFKRK